MKQIVLDFRDARTPSGIHRVLAEGLDFPPYYGANLDALWDCLSDWQGGGESDDRREIRLLPPERRECPPYLKKVLSVFEEAAEAFALPVAGREALREYLKDHSSF